MEGRIQAFSGSPSLIFLSNPVILELALLSTPAAVIPLWRPRWLLLWRLHPLWLLWLTPGLLGGLLGRLLWLTPLLLLRLPGLPLRELLWLTPLLLLWLLHPSVLL